MSGTLQIVVRVEIEAAHQMWLKYNFVTKTKFPATLQQIIWPWQLTYLWRHVYYDLKLHSLIRFVLTHYDKSFMFHTEVFWSSDLVFSGTMQTHDNSLAPFLQLCKFMSNFSVYPFLIHISRQCFSSLALLILWIHIHNCWVITLGVMHIRYITVIFGDAL